MSQSQQYRQILIVDDSPEDCVTIRRYLSRDQSMLYTIHEAHDGKQGLSLCQEVALDCVLLDYNLPDMNGVAFLDRLHTLFKQPLLPVVVLTGGGSEMIAVESMKSGALDYVLKKQLTPELLRHSITNAIEKMRMQQQVEAQHVELMRQRHAFQTLAENASDIISRYDPALRHIYVNPAVTKITGLPVEAFLNKTKCEMGFPEDFCATWEKNLREVFATGKITQIEFSYSSTIGLRIFQAKLTPEFDSAGQVISVLSISRDVTELKETEAALRESDERLHLAFSAASMGTWDWNIKTGKVFWSEDMEALLGMAPGTFSGTYEAFCDLVHPDDLVRVTAPLQQALQQKSLYQADFRMLRVDGSVRWVTSRGHAFYDDDGQPVRMIGVDLDITERKQSEQQATERASELEAFFEAIGDGLFILDTQGNPVRLNRAARGLMGVKTGMLSERLSIPPLPFVDEQGRPLPDEQRPETRLLRGEHLAGPTASDMRLRRATGSEVELSVTGTPLLTEDGEVGGAIMVTHDVTRRRRLERRTHAALDALLMMAKSLISTEGPSVQTEQTGRAVMQRLAELTCRVLDCEGALLFVLAPGTERIEYSVGTGFDASLLSPLLNRVQGMSLKDLFQIPAVRQLREGGVVSLDVSQPPYHEYQLHPHLHRAILAPLCLHSDLIGMAIVYPMDVYHRYLTEEVTLVTAVGQLAVLVIERERLLREREEARVRELTALETTRRIDDFIGIVSHELKSPLTAVRANVQLAKRQLNRILSYQGEPDGGAVPDIATIGNFLERAERQIMTQTRLVNDLVDSTRVRMEKLDLQVTRCDLQKVVQETIEDQRQASLKHAIQFSGVEGEVFVWADAQRVGQVITNYLSNAIKYSDEDTMITVRLERCGSSVKVSVCDQGPGLPLDVQQHIWDRFYRVPGVEVKSGTGVGLGLGLHICRTIIERQGGTVGVSSTLNQGSTFWFTLPLYANANELPLKEEHTPIPN
ncbi:PAS domain S-box protein [Dictyobacter halimunensis]